VFGHMAISRRPDGDGVDRRLYAPMMARWWTVAMQFVSCGALVGLVVLLVG
jgi:hypothetical protein